MRAAVLSPGLAPVVLLLFAAAVGCAREPATQPGPAAGDVPAEPIAPAAEPDGSPAEEIARLVRSFARGQSAEQYARNRERLAELAGDHAERLQAAAAEFEAKAVEGDVTASDVLDNVCDVLQAGGDERSGAMVLPWIVFPDARLRVKAVQTAARLVPAGAAEALAARAADPGEATAVRSAALEGLATIGDESVAPRLRSLLGADAPAELRIRAIAALGLLRDKESADRIAALATTIDAPESVEAMRALVRLRDPRGFEKIEPLYRSADAHFRLQAATILAHSGTPDAQERLRALAGDPEAAVRQVVASALIDSVESPAVEETLRALAEDRSSLVKRPALFSAGKRGYPWALEALRGAAKDREDPDRLAAMLSLGRCRDRGAIELLLAAAGDPDDEPPARLTASNNLARIGDPAVLDRLFPIVSEAEGTLPSGDLLRESMAVGLANFGAAVIEPALAFYRKSKDPRAKRAVITVLRFVGGRSADRAREALRSLLAEETDQNLRRDLEKALNR